MLVRPARTRQRGDTLIEVLFAITVFSLAVVTSLSIMNQGTSASIRSLQITLTRQQIDSQAEALRFMSSAYVAAYYPGYAPNTDDATTSPAEEFYKIIEKAKESRAAGVSSVTEFGAASTSCPDAPPRSFIINTKTIQLDERTSIHGKAETLPEVLYNDTNAITASKGLWIEALRSGAGAVGTNQDSASYTDFHIRACWDASGVNRSTNLGTIVRLYEPTQRGV